jgi:hypothetical protein
MRPLVFALYLGTAALAACGGGRSASPVDTGAAPEEPGSAADAGVLDAATVDQARDEDAIRSQCAIWCTEIAVCWERVKEAEYNHGGICVVDCRRKPEADRRAFGRCVSDSTDDCPVMLEC